MLDANAENRPPLNPVEQRLMGLCEHWLSFRDDPVARLLIWQVPDSGLRTVRCFFEVQKLDLPYSSGDMFIVLDADYEHALQYSRALKAQIKGQFDASEENLVAEAPTIDNTPLRNDLPDTPKGVIDTLRSLGSRLHRTIGYLAAALLPAQTRDATAYGAWLLRTLDCQLPERLRLIAVDSVENPALSALTEKNDPRICVQRLDLDGLELAQETFAQEAVSGPSGQFRNQLMGIITLLEKAPANDVKAKAMQALQFAQQQGWKDQEVVVRSLVAGALLKENRHAEAVQVYQSARIAAEQALSQAHPAGHKLILQTWFGEAGAEFAAGHLHKAAQAYDAAALVAQHDKDRILSIEAYRMSAFCYAELGEIAEALTRCECLLAIGETLKPEARAMTSLPLAALAYLRYQDPESIHQIEQRYWRLQNDETLCQQQAEHAAELLESHYDPAQAEQIELRLSQERQQLNELAEQDLMRIIASASADMQRSFTRSRALLGPDWPLQSAIFLTQPPLPDQGLTE